MGGDLSEGVLQVGRREFQEADQLLWLRDQGQRIEEVETALSRGTVGWAENRLTGSVEGPGKARGNVFMGCQPDRASAFFCLPQCLLGESRELDSFSAWCGLGWSMEQEGGEGVWDIGTMADFSVSAEY